jgi:hypothetical protein
VDEVIIFDYTLCIAKTGACAHTLLGDQYGVHSPPPSVPPPPPSPMPREFVGFYNTPCIAQSGACAHTLLGGQYGMHSPPPSVSPPPPSLKMPCARCEQLETMQLRGRKTGME